MSRYASYIICGTPRSGSTMLCEMLSETGVSGRPNSFFRQQSIGFWADRWQVEHRDGFETADFDRRYLEAMLAYGANGSGTFGLRLMWGSMEEAMQRLARVYGYADDLASQLENAFGSVLYLHLSRLDKVAQAVSLVRAEQSGLWHVSADGSVFEGTAAPQPNVYDGTRIGTLVDELHSDEAAWEAFFLRHGIAPLRLTYETMSADPQAALAAVLTALGHDASIARRVGIRTAKMGDGISAQWVQRFRSESGALPR